MTMMKDESIEQFESRLKQAALALDQSLAFVRFVKDNPLVPKRSSNSMLGMAAESAHRAHDFLSAPGITCSRPKCEGDGEMGGCCDACPNHGERWYEGSSVERQHGPGG